MFVSLSVCVGGREHALKLEKSIAHRLSQYGMLSNRILIIIFLANCLNFLAQSLVPIHYHQFDIFLIKVTIHILLFPANNLVYKYFNYQTSEFFRLLNKHFERFSLRHHCEIVHMCNWLMSHTKPFQLFSSVDVSFDWHILFLHNLLL